MKPTPEIIAAVNQTPDLDEFGKVHGSPWPENTAIYDLLLETSGDSIRQVVGMLQAVDDGTDYKPRYVLHGLVMYTGRPEKQTQRQLLRETFCSELAEDYPAPIKGYLLRQLHLCGSAACAPAVGAFLLDEENWEYAAQALQAIGGDASLAEIRASLPKSERSDKHLLTVVQALGWFRDSQSAPAIRKHLNHENEGIRLAAAWMLATVVDSEATTGLLQLMDNSKGWARLQATDSSLTLADGLEAAGNNALAKKIRDHIKAAQKAIEPVT